MQVGELGALRHDIHSSSPFLFTEKTGRLGMIKSTEM